jgi:hypothetical protein
MVQHVWLALGIWLARMQQKPNEENDPSQLQRSSIGQNEFQILLNLQKH